MHRTQTGSPARRRRTLATALALPALAAGAALALSLSTAAAPAGARAAGVSVRVEGPHGTLLPARTVALGSGTFTKDGNPADACSRASAAGALELATAGRWVGTWSKSLKGYFVAGVDGVSLPASGGEYWAFWIDNAPASAGICGVRPKPGDSILLFPDCYGKKCPPNAGVLGVRAPALARVGRPVKVMVTAFADANGKPHPAAGALVRGGGASARTSAAGTARLTFAHAGRVTLEVSAPHAVRTEAPVCVAAAGASSCG